jgi:hypothetical protein
MKIPLVIRDRFHFPAPYALIAIRGVPLGFRALVDTGSPWTVITPMGSAMLKTRGEYSPKRIARDIPDVTFAGHKFKRYETNLEICIKDAQGKIFTFKKPNPAFLKPKGKVDHKEFKEVPIIIGCDFLEANGLTLQFNPVKKIAYLKR